MLLLCVCFEALCCFLSSPEVSGRSQNSPSAIRMLSVLKHKDVRPKNKRNAVVGFQIFGFLRLTPPESSRGPRRPPEAPGDNLRCILLGDGTLVCFVWGAFYCFLSSPQVSGRSQKSPSAYCLLICLASLILQKSGITKKGHAVEISKFKFGIFDASGGLRISPRRSPEARISVRVE